MKQKLGRKLLSFLLALAIVIGLMPEMGSTAHAATYEGNPYAGLVNTTATVKFNNVDWYIIEDGSTAVNVGTVTLFAKDPFCNSKFSESGNNKYSESTVKSYLDNLTNAGGSFADVAGAIKTVRVNTDNDSAVDAKLWLLSTTEVNTTYQLSTDVIKCSTLSGATGNYWWLRSPGENYYLAATGDTGGEVQEGGEDTNKKYGVRPALRLDLSKVTFDTASNTFSLYSVLNLINDDGWYVLYSNYSGVSLAQYSGYAAIAYPSGEINAGFQFAVLYEGASAPYAFIDYGKHNQSVPAFQTPVRCGCPRRPSGRGWSGTLSWRFRAIRRLTRWMC